MIKYNILDSVPIKNIDDSLSEEKIPILPLLKQYHEIYNILLRAGKINFIDQDITFASKNEEGEYEIFFYKEKWDNEYSALDKIFLICHECLHIQMDHFGRLDIVSSTGADRKRINWAADCAVNDYIFNVLHIKPHLLSLKLAEHLSTTEKLRKILNDIFAKGEKNRRLNEEDIPNNQSAEFYFKFFKLLPDDLVNQMQNPLFDDHDQFDIKDSLVENDGETFFSPSHSSEGGGEEGEGKCGGENGSGIFASCAEKKRASEKERRQQKSIERMIKKINQHRTHAAKKYQKEIWNSLVKKWIQITQKKRNKSKIQHADMQESWVFQKRRTSLIQKNSNFLLPSEHEEENQNKKTWFPKIAIFIDVSASCHKLIPIFFSLMKQLPLKKYFSIDVFAFAETVEQINHERRNSPQISIYKLAKNQGTRTVFENMNTVLKTWPQMKKDNHGYDIVACLTDGKNTSGMFKPEILPPEKWFFIMLKNEGEYEKAYIPKESKIILI